LYIPGPFLRPYAAREGGHDAIRGSRGVPTGLTARGAWRGIARMRAKYRKWTMAERLKAAQGKVEGLDKSRGAIARRRKRKELATLKRVLRIRALYQSGKSVRTLNKMFRSRVDSIVAGTSFFDPSYSPRKISRKKRSTICRDRKLIMAERAEIAGRAVQKPVLACHHQPC
jgi:hypothetical protein